jgi:hypothetical protein
MGTIDPNNADADADADNTKANTKANAKAKANGSLLSFAGILEVVRTSPDGS